MELVSLEDAQGNSLSPWRQSIVRLIQKLVVGYRVRGLSHLIWKGRSIILGSGLKTVKYRDRFYVLCDCDSRYSVMRVSGYIHRAHDRLLKTLLSEINHDIVFIDVGANEGFVSLLACSSALKTQQTIHAHCFEPNPTAFRVLITNSSLNSFRMTLNDFALGDNRSSGVLTLGTEPSDSTLVSGGFSYVSTVGQEQVGIETLDAYCSEHSLVPTVIKIDVEGYEPYVLKGASQVLEQVRPYLIVEINSRTLSAGGNSAADLLDLLDRYGYQSFHINHSQAGLLKDDTCKRQRWRGYIEVHPLDVAQECLFDVLALPTQYHTIRNK